VDSGGSMKVIVKNLLKSILIKTRESYLFEHETLELQSKYFEEDFNSTFFVIWIESKFTP
jgi:hypothetical protein